jgi:hypothetical protein
MAAPPPAPPCSLRPLGRRVHLFSLVSVFEHELLHHFLSYYALQGVRLRSNAHIVLHHGVEDVASEQQRAAAVLDSFGVADVVVVAFHNLSALEEHKLGRLNRLTRSLPSDAWIIFANVDELFEYPCDITHRLPRTFAVCAHMLDRYNLDASGHVAPVRSSRHGTLSEQFPFCGKVRGQFLHLTTLKLTLARAHVPARDAHPGSNESLKAGTATWWQTEHHAFINGRSTGGYSGLRCHYTGRFSHYSMSREGFMSAARKVASYPRDGKAYRSFLLMAKRCPKGNHTSTPTARMSHEIDGEPDSIVAKGVSNVSGTSQSWSQSGAPGAGAEGHGEDRDRSCLAYSQPAQTLLKRMKTECVTPCSCVSPVDLSLAT